MPHVLVVDDDLGLAHGLAEVAAKASFTATVVGTLTEARAAIARSAPDVVLLDVHLPDGSGLELFDSLRPPARPEVVLITGKPSVETAVEAMRRGAADYLVKPVDVSVVLKALGDVSRTRELKDLVGALPWSRQRRLVAPACFGRYIVEGEIGGGAMGRVYRATDPTVARTVAIKTVKSELLVPETREEYLGRFRQEAQAAGHLSHPCIVSIFDVSEDFIVMEYVEGATLQELLRHRSPMDRAAALRTLVPLAEALDYAHAAGVVHRDIKPSNIMVQPDGRPKLMDFGVAHLEGSSLTQAGQIFGSPSYMSPELVLGAPVTSRSDLFSFAVVAYEALTGRRPFQGENVGAIVHAVAYEAAPLPSTVNPTLPRSDDDIFASALSKDPAQRHPSALALVTALAEGGDASAHPDISPDRLLEALLAVPPEAVETHDLEAPRAPAGAAVGGGALSRVPIPAVRPAVGLSDAARTWKRSRYPWIAALLVAVTAIFVGHLVTRARAPVSEGVVPLRIQTEPPRVQVWLDGQPRGVSPLVAESLAPGSHRVRVVAEGYAPAELTLDLARGTTPAPLRFVMVPVGAPLRVDSEPAGAIVRLGDRRVGETPLVLIVAPGAHVVRVEHKGFRPHVSRLDARAGQPLQVVARLESLTRERAPEGRDAGVAQAAPTDTAARTERPAASVTPPRLVAGDSPAYPEAARRMKLSGSVLVEMTVTEKGEPKDVRILESAGAILDEAVLGPLRHWRFQPARQDGVAVPVRWRYRHTFS